MALQPIGKVGGMCKRQVMYYDSTIYSVELAMRPCIGPRCVEPTTVNIKIEQFQDLQGIQFMQIQECIP
jgi:hypothetical protein